MCFSNLPVEFDEEGNPSLADEAEDVEQPGTCTHDGDCNCAADDDEIETDPEATYETIVASLPAGAREHVEGGTQRTKDRGEQTTPDQYVTGRPATRQATTDQSDAPSTGGD